MLQESHNASIGELASFLVNINAEDMIQVVECVFFSHTASKTYVPIEYAEELIAAALLNCDFSKSENYMEQLARWKDHIRTSRWLMETWPEEECCK